MRTSPYELRKDKEAKAKFIELITTHFRFVESFTDESITPDFVRLFHRRKSVSEAIQSYIEDVKSILRRNGISYTECTSTDMKKTSDSRRDLHQTDDVEVVQMLNNKVREPRELLFYPGALFSSTTNAAQYSQSQTLMMLDVPSAEDVRNRRPLTLYAAPPDDGITSEMLNFVSPPSKEDLVGKGWKEVKVEICSERLITRNHISACRRQYSLVHVGASTVSLTETTRSTQSNSAAAYLYLC